MTKIMVEDTGADELKGLVRSALEHEIKFISIGIRKTEESLRKLEDIHAMPSEQFYAKYSSGELGDSLDFIKWAGEVEILEKLQRSLKELAEAEVC
jgi:hypothetical protein